MARRWITRFDIPCDDRNDDLAHALDLATSRPLDEITGRPRRTLCGMPIPHGQTSPGTTPHPHSSNSARCADSAHTSPGGRPSPASGRADDD